MGPLVNFISGGLLESTDGHQNLVDETSSLSSVLWRGWQHEILEVLDANNGFLMRGVIGDGHAYTRIGSLRRV